MAYIDDSKIRNNAIKKMAEAKENHYVAPDTGNAYQDSQQKALDAITGKSGIYLSPNDAANAYRTAYPNPVVRSQSSGNNIRNAYRQALEQQTNAILQQQSQQESLLHQQNELRKRQRKMLLDNTIAANNNQAKQNMREAYIANMLFKRNLPQQLKGAGISGGSSESAMINRQNTYMNNRNNIDRALLDANNNARLAYQQGVNSDYDDYLGRLYNLRSNVYGRLQQVSSDYTKSISDKTGGNRQYTASLAGTGIKVTGTKDQVIDGIGKRLSDMGYSASEIEKHLKNSGLTR